MQVHLQKVQVSFICQGHRVKFKVTAGKCKYDNLCKRRVTLVSSFKCIPVTLPIYSFAVSATAESSFENCFRNGDSRRSFEFFVNSFSFVSLRLLQPLCYAFCYRDLTRCIFSLPPLRQRVTLLVTSPKVNKYAQTGKIKPKFKKMAVKSKSGEDKRNVVFS